MESAAKESGNRWRHWALPIFLTVVIVALAVWAVTRRVEPIASVDVSDSAKLELIAILTHASPTADLSTRARKTYNNLPQRFRRTISRFVRPAPSQIVTGSNLQERDITLVFLAKSRDGAWLSKNELSQAVDKAEFDWVRFNYGNGYYSQVARLEQDYTMGSGEKVVRIATIPGVPAVEDRLTLEFLKIGSTWNYGLAHKSAKLVTSVEIDNPLHRAVLPLQNPVSLPAQVAHGNTTVTLRRLVSHVTGEQLQGFVPAPDALRNSPTAFKASKGTGDDPHFSLAVLDLDEHGTTSPEWGIANVSAFYGKSEIPFGSNGTPHSRRNGPYIQIFGNDVSLLKQPVKLAVELVHKRNFGPDELQTVELPLPPKGEKSVPAADTQLHFWNNRVEVIGAFHDLPAHTGHSTMGNGRELAVVIKYSSSTPQIMTVQLVGPEGKWLDLSDYGNTFGTSSGNGGNFFYRAFDIEKAVQELSKESLADYTTVTVDIVSPKPHLKTFEFIVEPAEVGWTAEK